MYHIPTKQQVGCFDHDVLNWKPYELILGVPTTGYDCWYFWLQMAHDQELCKRGHFVAAFFV